MRRWVLETRDGLIGEVREYDECQDASESSGDGVLAIEQTQPARKLISGVEERHVGNSGGIEAGWQSVNIGQTVLEAFISDIPGHITAHQMKELMCCRVKAALGWFGERAEHWETYPLEHR